jgi:putative spermidine/putrescine transport system permease protein
MIRLAGRLLVSAYVALFVIFMLAPLVFVVINSFNEARFSTFPPPGLSLQWYVRLFSIPEFFVGLRNSLVVAILSTILSITLGTCAALALVRGRWRASQPIESLLLSPLLVPKIIIGIAVFIAAIRVGLYPGFASLVLAHTAIILPYVVTIVAANLQQVDRTQEEAATDLGAGRLLTFRLATVPQIKRGILLAAVFAFVLSFDEFDVSLFLTRADNMTLPIRMYLYMQELEDPTLAALSTLLIAVSAVVAGLIACLSRGLSVGSLFAKGRPS